MHRIKQAKTNNCPICNHVVETNWHVLSCPKCSLWREELLCTLGDTMANNHTQPGLALMLIQGI
jgi:Zn finger protein HypA/HybF involved in hydrogenase expression